MLKVKNLTKRFNSKTAVSGVSFEVRTGEIFALIGPNGSGKTTIIKTIAGLLRPSDGKIEVAGHDAVKEPVKAKTIIGYIPDDPSVWPSMTGEEFLNFSGALYGIKSKERARRIPDLLALFGFRGLETGNFEDYSRGNKQKFTILAALLSEPKILLIDEPIVGLDPVSAGIAKQKFMDFAYGGGAVLLATHTLAVAQEIADKIGVLCEGKLRAVGTFPELKLRAGLGEGATLEDVYRTLT